MSYVEALFGVKNRVAVVTGPTKGIGQAIAIALAKAGADVFLLQRNIQDTGTADQIKAVGRRAHILQCDMSSIDQVRAAAAELCKLAPRIDILVNNAGTIINTPALDIPLDEFNLVMAVNLQNIWVLTQAIGKQMVETRAADASLPRAKIVNVGSLMAIQSSATSMPYTVSKHALLGLTRSLSNQWSSLRVNVNLIAPGWTATDLSKFAREDPVRNEKILGRLPVRRWAQPDEIASAVLYLAAPASDYVCGEVHVVDGGWLNQG